MTKYEWETELKRNIHRLPPDEIKRVMDYYGELFDDYAERGKRETEIINEFGNPIDVADKILAEYDGEQLRNGDNAAVADDALKDVRNIIQAPQMLESETTPPGVTGDQASSQCNGKDVVGRQTEAETGEKRSEDKRNVRSERVLLFVLLSILTGGAFFISVGIIWLALCMLVLGSVGIGLGGIFTAVVGIGLTVTGKLGSGLAQLGIGIAAVGLGIILTLLFVKLVRICAALTKKMFVKLYDWLIAKKENV